MLISRKHGLSWIAFPILSYDAKVRVYVNDEFQGLMRNDDLPEDSIHSRGQYVLPGCFVRQRDCFGV